MVNLLTNFRQSAVTKQTCFVNPHAPGFPLTPKDLGYGDKSRYLDATSLPCPILVLQRCGEQLCIPRSP
jgi:hypothetical protein